MAKYLTPTQYVNADAGISLADVTTPTLARTIARAESDIDAFMGFDLRLGGFEPHTGWVQEQWDAKHMRVRFPNFPVPVRRALRYQIQVSNLTTSGAGFMAIIAPNDISYNAFDYYVEIVPLQSVTYSLAPVLVQLGLRPPIVQWDFEAGYFLASWGETLINNGDNKTYSALRGFWASSYTQAASMQPQTLPAIPPVVYKNGVVQSSGFVLSATEGTVTFSSANAATDVMSADYCYTIPDDIRDATIERTTFLLIQRSLNKAGLGGLEMARSGDQQVMRPRNPEAFLVQGVSGASLNVEAASRLVNYMSVPVA